MNLSYESLICGCPIQIEGIGTFMPPKVRELTPNGIGTFTYNLYVTIFTWDKDDFVDFVKKTTKRSLAPLTKNKKITAFDAITLFQDTRELLSEALGFFLFEEVNWDETNRKFVVTSKEGEKIGEICRDNYEDVKDVVLQMNYIKVGQSAKPITHSSKKSQALWEKAQEYLKKESVKDAKDKTYELGNIISKLCAVGIGYTLFNVYDLTIFQLYDQFFQYGYLRAMDLNEMAFSNHGGEKFDIRAWLKPILKF